MEQTLFQDRISGVVRAVLALGAGYFASKFKFDVASLDTLVTSATLTITTIVWSWFTKNTTPYVEPKPKA
jgi:hypothetical protein